MRDIANRSNNTVDDVLRDFHFHRYSFDEMRWRFFLVVQCSNCIFSPCCVVPRFTSELHSLRDVNAYQPPDFLWWGLEPLGAVNNDLFSKTSTCAFLLADLDFILKSSISISGRGKSIQIISPVNFSLSNWVLRCFGHPTRISPQKGCGDEQYAFHAK